MAYKMPIDVSTHLIRDLTLVDRVRIALRVVDARLDDPLVIEGGEARRLVEQLVHVLVGAVRLQLQICGAQIRRANC